MTYLLIKELAFEYAARIGSFPSTWNENSKAGIDWMKMFMNQHPGLSLQKHENTSLSRATSFNKDNVALFQENLNSALKLHAFSADRIVDLDETRMKLD